MATSEIKVLPTVPNSSAQHGRNTAFRLLFVDAARARDACIGAPEFARQNVKAATGLSIGDGFLRQIASGAPLANQLSLNTSYRRPARHTGGAQP
jgi:hypothetical protein